jgi:homogentisate 1,2-dioxygenase
MEPIDQIGDFTLILKVSNRYFEYNLPHHPFDVVGWDGFLYPYTFNIKEYAPKVGKIHLPPPTHLVFTTQHFVVCNFVPRLYDFHPDAIPAPYYHSNVDSDEVFIMCMEILCPEQVLRKDQLLCIRWEFLMDLSLEKLKLPSAKRN